VSISILDTYSIVGAMKSRYIFVKLINTNEAAKVFYPVGASVGEFHQISEGK
jgi:hypothetical protein